MIMTKTTVLDLQRLQLQITGAVQGVGFRPFVYHLAQSLDLTGWICNTDQGVLIELEGATNQLQEFQNRLLTEKPTHAYLQQIIIAEIEVLGEHDFTIRPSDKFLSSQPKSALILPDLATCSACLADIFDPTNRHYLYPFTNCTHCGPRFSIVRSLPYDRVNTTLQKFPLCLACQAEYDNPNDRRFHAQPNACSICGPHLELWDQFGEIITTQNAALQQSAAAVRAGQILALKGLGGFHLIVDARNNLAIKTLRDRKHRPDKPLAVMFSSIEQVQEYCQVDALAAQILQSGNAPIVLLPIHNSSSVTLSAFVAPGNPYLGVILAYTPLHHLLLAELGFPIVATSGNRSGEPICIDETQAPEILAGIADIFLVHNRPIAHPVDDSILQLIGGQASLLRRARGYAPLPIALDWNLEVSNNEVILAVGSHLKNTIALHVQQDTQQQLFISQHLGNLDRVSTCNLFKSTIQELNNLYNTIPTIIVCDAHPDYYSTQFAQQLVATTPANEPAPRIISVQHHYAHILSCVADNQWLTPVLGVAWDGTGYGLDGTIWGGEFLWLPAMLLPEPGFIRVAHLQTFCLPGGEAAVKEPRRSAVGLLYECLGESAFAELNLAPLQSFLPQELVILQTILRIGLNTPRTSSMGRLFDAVSALLGLCQKVSFAGQAALQLEWAIDGYVTDAVYPYQIRQQINSLENDLPLQFDYTLMIRAILRDLSDRVPLAAIAATFHNTLVAGLVDIAIQLRNHCPEMIQIVLTGGCFQNRYLLERSINHLQKQNFIVGYHHQIPCNDGGISAGQVMAALRLLQYESTSTNSSYVRS
jgi:hydrogenase maturation protein HypF